MNIRSAVCSFLLMFVLSSCTGSSSSMSDLFPEKKSITPKNHVFDLDSIRKSINMYYLDGKLYLIDMYTSPLVTVFDWAGNPIKEIDLPQYYDEIAASETEIILLGKDPETYDYVVHTIDISDL